MEVVETACHVFGSDHFLSWFHGGEEDICIFLAPAHKAFETKIRYLYYPAHVLCTAPKDQCIHSAV